MADGLEFEGLDRFEKKLLSKATKELPRETFKMVRKIGSKARTEVARKSRKEVEPVTGTYSKSWKRGKAFKNGDTYAVYIKNTAPHAHLIENGHRIVDQNGDEHGFVEGKHILEDGLKEFGDKKLEGYLEEWLDNLLDEGLL